MITLPQTDYFLAREDEYPISGDKIAAWLHGYIISSTLWADVSL